jgi:DNA-binding CsgD family transcriptional regulator
MNELFFKNIMLSAVWISCWILSIIVCFIATAVSLNRLKFTRDKHLWHLILLQITLIFNLFFNFTAHLNWYNPILSDVTRIGAMVTSALAIVSLPAFINSYSVTFLHRNIGRFFYFAGFALAIHYFVSSIFFFIFRYDGSLKYFGGYRYIPAYTLFIMQILAALYVVTAIFVAKPVSEEDKNRVKILRLIAYIILISLPFVFILDQVRYFFPPLWQLLTEERLFVVPFCVAVINLLFIRYVRKGLSGIKPEKKSFKNLSIRESEVADLLCEGYRYKEIAKKLYISLATVQSHVTNIYKKVGVSKKTDLILRKKNVP